MILCEVEYIDKETGKRVIEEIEGFSNACELARVRARKSGKRVVIRRKPKPQWYVIAADLKTGDIVRVPIVMTKGDAAAFWLEWKAKQQGMVCILWPQWAPEPKIELGGC